MFESMNERLTSYGVIPVVVLNKASSAVQLGRALEAGGLDLAEITFRTAAAEESIRLMSRAFPNMLIGAGTVLTIDQVNRAVAAGAKFIVSPAFDPELVDYCIKRDIPVYPGVATPTEALMGIKRGLTLMKFFPAEQLGGIKAERHPLHAHRRHQQGQPSQLSGKPAGWSRRRFLDGKELNDRRRRV